MLFRKYISIIRTSMTTVPLFLQDYFLNPPPPPHTLFLVVPVPNTTLFYDPSLLVRNTSPPPYIYRVPPPLGCKLTEHYDHSITSKPPYSLKTDSKQKHLDNLYSVLWFYNQILCTNEDTYLYI